ncbi:MAG: hypothetical protein AAGD92_03450 [Pseudomonadota bacterium]
MNFLLIILAASGIGYGAPSSEIAYEAYVERLVNSSRFAGDVLGADNIREQAAYPFALQLDRCVARRDHPIRLSREIVARYDGYECVMEIWPNGEPAYRTFGFFRYTGLDWEYHGSVAPRFDRLRMDFNLLDDNGEILTKPGALPYEGDPDDPFNDDINPYDELLDLSETFSAPSLELER